MKGQQEAVQPATTFDNVHDLIVDAIRDIKGQNIVKIDLSEVTDASVDYFIICEGESTVQVKAIATNVAKRLREEWDGTKGRMQGLKESKWVLLDLFDTVVHVFYPETRAFYDLEGLWSDGKFTEYQEL